MSVITGAGTFEQAVTNDPNWRVARFDTQGLGLQDLLVTKTDDYSLLDELAALPDTSHFISEASRPGAYFFARLLELQYFPPGTPKNRDYRFCFVRWEGLMWAVVSIPTSLRGHAEAACERARLRIADGIPTIFQGGRPLSEARHFPLRTAESWGLENVFGQMPLTRAEEGQIIRELESSFGRNN